jgi:hypothetical protein
MEWRRSVGAGLLRRTESREHHEFL